MAVLCEAISVVVRAERALAAFGSFEAYKAIIPNETLVADNELMRVGFMVPDDVKAFVDLLERNGLQYLRDGKAVDVVVVDQMHGPAVSCDWLEYGKVSLSGSDVSAARLKGSSSTQLFTPDGWRLEGSLSQTFGFVPSGSEDKAMRFIRHEGGLDVYFNPLTGKEVYVGRTDSGTD
jgi:hypothetical protein